MLQLRTRREIIAALRQRRIHLKKSLGQNLLIDHNLLELIVREGGVDRSDAVLEVGAGSGLLTRHLAGMAGHVIAVEIDPQLVPLFHEHTSGLDNIDLLQCDVLASKSKLNPAVVAAMEKAMRLPGIQRLKCVANLPYSVSTIVIPLLLEGPLPVELMVFTVQKEVCDRLAAGPGTKDYGSLSVIVQAHASVDAVRVLGPKVFLPEPQVDSAIVRITPNDDIMRGISDYAAFAEVARGLFLHRRKKAIGSLELLERFRGSRERLAAAFRAAGVDESARADQLSVQQIVRLANAITAENL